MWRKINIFHLFHNVFLVFPCFFRRTILRRWVQSIKFFFHFSLTTHNLLILNWIYNFDAWGAGVKTLVWKTVKRKEEKERKKVMKDFFSNSTIEYIFNWSCCIYILEFNTSLIFDCWFLFDKKFAWLEFE